MTMATSRTYFRCRLVGATLILGLFFNLSDAIASTSNTGIDNITSQIATCKPGTLHCVIDLHGAYVTIFDTLHINPLRVTIRDGILDATQVPQGHPAILVSSDGDNTESYDTAQNSLDHLVLLGTSNADGIVFNNQDVSAIRAADITVENVSLSGFRRGITFGNHAYGIGLAHMQIHNNAVGVYTVPHAIGAGERIAFSDVGVFNNRIGIDDEGGMEMDWVGSRWDYNTTTAILAGLIEFDGHIEMEKSSNPIIALHALEGQIAGALFMSVGSFVLVNDSGGQAGGDYWITSDSPYNIVQFPVSTYGVRGKIDVMQGPGKVFGPSLPTFHPN